MMKHSKLIRKLIIRKGEVSPSLQPALRRSSATPSAGALPPQRPLTLQFGIFLLFFAAGFAGAQTEDTSRKLTIDEAVQLALDNNVNLKQNVIALNGKKRSSDRSWNSFIPQLSAGATISHPTSITDSLAAKQNSWTPGFQLSASLSLSAETINNIKKAGIDYDAGAISYEQAKQELELQVRKLYYQIILLDNNRELAVRSLENARSRYEQSAALAGSGQAARLDELSARVDMENKKPALRSAQTAYDNALDSFKTLLDIPAGETVTLSGALDTSAIGSVDPAAAETKGESLETAALIKSIELLEAQQSAARGNAYASNLRLAWNSAPLYANEEWRDNAGSFSVTLGMSLDNFIPWSNVKTQIDSIGDSIDSARLSLSESLRGRENRITQLKRTIEAAAETIEILKLNVELAETTYDLYVDAYGRGAMDYQRLRDAADSLLQAQNQVQQEQYNFISAVLDLEKELNVPFGTL